MLLVYACEHLDGVDQVGAAWCTSALSMGSVPSQMGKGHKANLILSLNNNTNTTAQPAL